MWYKLGSAYCRLETAACTNPCSQREDQAQQGQELLHLRYGYAKCAFQLRHGRLSFWTEKPGNTALLTQLCLQPCWGAVNAAEV